MSFGGPGNGDVNIHNADSTTGRQPAQMCATVNLSDEDSAALASVADATTGLSGTNFGALSREVTQLSVLEAVEGLSITIGNVTVDTAGLEVIASAQVTQLSTLQLYESQQVTQLSNLTVNVTVDDTVASQQVTQLSTIQLYGSQEVAELSTLILTNQANGATLTNISGSASTEVTQLSTLNLYNAQEVAQLSTLVLTNQANGATLTNISGNISTEVTQLSNVEALLTQEVAQLSTLNTTASGQSLESTQQKSVAILSAQTTQLSTLELYSSQQVTQLSNLTVDVVIDDTVASSQVTQLSTIQLYESQQVAELSTLILTNQANGATLTNISGSLSTEVIQLSTLNLYNAQEVAQLSTIITNTAASAPIDTRPYLTAEITQLSTLQLYGNQEVAQLSTLTLSTQSNGATLIQISGSLSTEVSQLTTMLTTLIQGPVAIGSPQDISVSGTIGATNAAVTVNTHGTGACHVVLTGTWVATIVIEGSADGGSTWSTLNAVQASVNAASALTVNGTYRIPSVSAETTIRARASAYTSGTVSVVIELSNPAGHVTVYQSNPANLNATVVSSQLATQLSTVELYGSQQVAQLSTLTTNGLVANVDLSAVTAQLTTIQLYASQEVTQLSNLNVTAAQEAAQLSTLNTTQTAAAGNISTEVTQLTNVQALLTQEAAQLSTLNTTATTISTNTSAGNTVLSSQTTQLTTIQLYGSQEVAQLSTISTNVATNTSNTTAISGSVAQEVTQLSTLIVNEVAGLTVVGNVAAGSADSGNGVKVAGVYNSTAPTLTNGQRGDLQLDSRSRVIVTVGDGGKATYSAAIVGLAPAAIPTDFFTITGSATKTIRITALDFSGTQTTTAYQDIEVLVRSAANTGGASTTLANVPHDSQDAAGTATVRAYTTNPTGLGALVGAIRSYKFDVPATGAAPTIMNHSPSIAFGHLEGKNIVLRGTTQVLAINGAGSDMPGSSWDIWIEWTEE
jgi:trimeric autotransporter adhesin